MFPMRARPRDGGAPTSPASHCMFSGFAPYRQDHQPHRKQVAGYYHNERQHGPRFALTTRKSAHSPQGKNDATLPGQPHLPELHITSPSSPRANPPALPTTPPLSPARAGGLRGPRRLLQPGYPPQWVIQSTGPPDSITLSSPHPIRQFPANLARFAALAGSV